MGAATRVEEAIRQSERQSFDLGALVRGAVAAYGTGFPHRKFVCDVPADPVEITGAPDLIVQLLDKLIDNAVDFSGDGATISVLVRVVEGFAELSVANQGPPLPPETATRLFESLWQSRADGDKRPHFGLGLYIVRLIAEFHGGNATAANLPGDAGAVFTIRLAR
jgi:signal transduction histidine kinase